MKMGSLFRPASSGISVLVLLLALLLAVVFETGNAVRCEPGKNCKAPNCRCWEDRTIPGGLDPKKTPQIVLLTFGNSINTATKNYSDEIMKGLINPNGCPALATFFIEELNTDLKEVKALYEAGFEIGMSTLNDTLPGSKDEWEKNIKRVQQGLIEAGIPQYSLRGFRSAQLYAGGDEAIDAFPKLNILYDSTCVNRQYTQMNNMLWPYTYDFPDHAPQCSIGRTPMKQHNGTWQMLMADLQFGTHNCPSPSACSPYIKTQEQVFEFLFANFLNHYNGNKAPFNLYLDPLWLSDEHHKKGTREFLEFVGALTDAWVLTFQQALDWIKLPYDSEQVINFPPWGCGKNGTYARQHRKINPRHRDIIRMKINRN